MTTNITTPEGAGSATLEMDDAHEPASSVGTKGQGKTDSSDSEDFSEAAQPAHEKRLATFSAHLALAGYELHPLSSGAFLIVRPGFQVMRHVIDLDSAAAFLRRVGGAAQ